MRAPVYQDPAVSLYLGDAREVLPELAAAGIVADMLLTDPPYAIGVKGRKLDRVGDRRVGVDMEFDGAEIFDWKECARIVSRVMRLSVDRVQPGGAAYVFISHRLFGLVERRLRRLSPKTGFIYWRKRDPVPQFTKTSWRNVMELVAWTGRPKNFLGQDEMQNEIVGPTVKGEARRHPTQKPEWLISKLILAATDPGDLILDPFAGSAVVLRVAKDLGRRAIGIELEERWVRKAIPWLHQDALPFTPPENGNGRPTQLDIETAISSNAPAVGGGPAE